MPYILWYINLSGQFSTVFLRLVLWRDAIDNHWVRRDAMPFSTTLLHCTCCSLQLRSSPITWKCQHFHGHQDKHVKYKDLSQEAQANVVVDGETKDQLQRVYAKEEGLLGAKGEPWFVQCKEDAKSGLNNVTFQFTKHTDRSSY